MQEDRISGPKLDSHLSNRFHKGQRLNITDSSSNFDQGNIGIFRAGFYTSFDLIGDMWDDLYRRTKIITPSFLADDSFVNFTAGIVAAFAGASSDKAFIVSQVKIRFRTILGDENFTVLEGTHCARIDVNIRIQLQHRHLKTTRFKNCR